MNAIETKLSITIYRNGIWAGNGYMNKYSEIECSAVLGKDQDASDETYEAITDQIENGDADGSVSQPDGEYTWEIKS